MILLQFTILDMILLQFTIFRHDPTPIYYFQTWSSSNLLFSDMILLQFINGCLQNRRRYKKEWFLISPVYTVSQKKGLIRGFKPFYAIKIFKTKPYHVLPLHLVLQGHFKARKIKCNYPYAKKNCYWEKKFAKHFLFEIFFFS